MKLTLSLFILLLLSTAEIIWAADPACHAEKMILDCFISFDAKPIDKHLEQLKAIAKKVAQSYSTDSPVDFITIDGFGVKWGNNNPVLMSEQRANFIAEELKKKLEGRGVQLDYIRFLVRGRGIEDPRASNSSKHGRALNRRVEIMLTQPPGFVYATFKPPIETKLQALKVRFKKYTFAKALPEKPPVNITGTYAVRYRPNSENYKDNRIVIQVNQAGNFLKLWYTRYEEFSDKDLHGKPITSVRKITGRGSGNFLRADSDSATYGKFKGG